VHAEDIIPTFFTSNIYNGICLPKAFALPRLGPNEIFKVLLIVSINQSVGLQGNLNGRLPRDAVPYRWREGFLSRREFCTIYNARSELHHFIFAE